MRTSGSVFLKNRYYPLVNVVDVNASAVAAAAKAATEATAGALSTVTGTTVHLSTMTLLAGIGLVALAIFIVFFLKRVIVNSILGIVAFLILKFLGVNLPFLLTLIVSVLFGLAGVGTVLVLHFFGLV